MRPISSRATMSAPATLAEMDAMRLCISFTSAPPAAAPGEPPPVPDRLLHARFAGEHYGVFDVFFDTRSPEQIIVGNASSHEDQIFYDLWMSFPMRSLRKTPLSDTRFGGPSGPLWTPHVLSINKYTINATIDPARNLSAEATLDVDIKQGGTRIVLFRIVALFAAQASGVRRQAAGIHSERSRRGQRVVAARQRYHRCGFSRSVAARRTLPVAIHLLPARCSPMPAADCSSSERAVPGIPTAASRWPITISPSAFPQPGR